jgi:hypothetical protein
MAGSTSNLDLIAASQAQKEVTANAVFDAMSPASLFGRRASTCAGLVWGYYGGAILAGGTDPGLHFVANGTVTLAASDTNYVEVDDEGLVTVNQTSFTSGLTPLYEIVTGATTVTSYTDWRVTLRGAAGTVDSVNSQTGDVVLGADDIAADDPGGYFTTDATTVELQLQEIGADIAALIGSSGDAMTSDPLSQFAATTSAQLAGVISDETGSGALVFGTSPTLVTPALGTPSALVLTNATGLPVAGGGTGVASLTAYAPIFGGTTGTGAVQSGTVGTAGQVLTSNGAGALPTMQSQPFDVHTFLPGVQSSANQLLYRGKVARAVSFPANFSGSQFSASANATGSTVFDIKKNGSSIGDCTIGAGGTSPTFTTTGGSAQSFAAGDLLSIVGPASADATLADIGFTLAGTR